MNRRQQEHMCKRTVLCRIHLLIFVILVSTDVKTLIFFLLGQARKSQILLKDHSMNCFLYVSKGSPCMDSPVNQLAFGSLFGCASPDMLSSKMLLLVSKNIGHHLKSTTAFDSMIIFHSSESHRLIKTTKHCFLNSFYNFLAFECIQCSFQLLFLGQDK